MITSEIIAYVIFVSYFLLIFLAFFCVFWSLLRGRNPGQLLSGRSFFFLRIAAVALVATWTYMIKFMFVTTQWSYDYYAKRHYAPTIGQWLANTGLFEQAWGIVCTGPSSWWWSSFICTWTVIFTAVVWTESGRRGIKWPWAYMLLGQLVAMSVATAMFISALYLHPRKRPSQGAPPRLYFPLLLALGTIHLLPTYTGTSRFLTNLLWMHGLLLVALLAPPSKDNEREKLGIPFPTLYALLGVLAAAIHIPNTNRLLSVIPKHTSVPVHLQRHIFFHPAQSSISLDVVCVASTLLLWYVASGSTAAIATKTIFLGTVGALLGVRYAGLTWGLIASLLPIVILAIGALLALYVQQMRVRNEGRRKNLLESMGVLENTVIPGTKNKPPRKASRATVIGFWHPYCNAGGGGERVLWSIIAYLQRVQPDTVILVYSGDYPSTSKEEMLDKVQERMSIRLSGDKLAFIPLPSRHLISDSYWKRFTLLGQSIGSVILAWEALCGAEGMWGDIFFDTMGYGFTYPFVRLICGGEIAIGAYTHYPTVSVDMVKRVRKGEWGVESGSTQRGWWGKQVKLVYYAIFTVLYSVSLLYAEVIMTNSSWTQAHITSLLLSARKTWLAAFLLKDEKALQARERRKEPSNRGRCEVVFPPCDVTGLLKLGHVGSRKREIVSLAQFRPEKDHAKQLYALNVLFDQYPECRDVRLTLMGGCRNTEDEQRLEGLKALAMKLGIEDRVEFVVNAPYPEVVRRLGQASIGLNTMQDEHFGINVVEFMAAGLIPVVHASAGPMMDIVVSHNGRQTGFHATDAESFASSLHTALSLSADRQLDMRRVARDLARDKFSQEKFESSFEQSWRYLIGSHLSDRPGI
ncbi:hypothetical protein TREMEDRAFT_73255 [Tremella mesenterica DSM 1558]|uniref:uncharacterized protein n=1 Tax=Tremella mesenterica (strain ATCC 24925 / CBS 8224 / DSM 1558 / NBRC 9311 / NRRL Y-6157 / RJB 2259-6 / UBC 559-6) TaxID=578456 RepID=UPI0003F4A1BA|nr:uncharacterized protein TREMEDRAFT_73255 [Tremella mesenterica DSM 1558]EIW71289.1 hypothetical protein TREMEDRAFT_73255 [Tremella mesenterica DSM 1558]